MSRINAVLILGCGGFSDSEDFIFCAGVDNIILDLEDISEQDYERLIAFFDKACGLFSSPVVNYNKISNILNMLYKTYGVINPEMLKKIQYYLNTHRKCDPYLLLMLKEDYNGR